MRPLLGSLLLHEPPRRRCANKSGACCPRTKQARRPARAQPAAGAATAILAARCPVASWQPLPYSSANQCRMAPSAAPRPAAVLLSQPVAAAKSSGHSATRWLGWRRCGTAWPHGRALSRRRFDGCRSDRGGPALATPPRESDARPRGVPSSHRRRLRLRIPQVRVRGDGDSPCAAQRLGPLLRCERTHEPTSSPSLRLLLRGCCF